jgi:uncharacterized protein (TIGR02001 family)
MRKTILAAAIGAAAAVPGLVHAQAAAQSPHSVSGNMAVVSDYRFRGISQTYLQPAIQGGIDYSHSSGLYLGNWNSSVSGLSYNNGGGIEMDFYGGFKKAFGDVTFDVGVLQYYYPKAQYTSGDKYDTTEIYLGAAWKWLSAKYSVTTSDWFGVNGTTYAAQGSGDSKGSGYLDISASYEIAPKLTLLGHFGMQTVKNFGALDYNDYKLGVTYDLNGWILGASYVDTDADGSLYFVGSDMKETGKGTVVLSVFKSF